MKIKFSGRELWFAAAMAALFVFYVFSQVLFFPGFREIHSVRAQLRAKRQELNVSEGKLKLLKNLEQAPLQGLRMKKTKEGQTIEALKHISGIISRLKLDLVSIRPRREEKSINSAKAILFDINFTGSYNNIHKFMGALETLPILVLVDSINLKRTEAGHVSVLIVLSVYY